MSRAASDATIARIQEMGQYVGHRVTVALRGSDVSSRTPVTITGHVLTLAVRERGSSGWTGDQVDMVLRPDSGPAKVFALTRIVSIDRIGGAR